LSKDGRTLATGSRDATIKIWDVTTSKEKASLQLPAPLTDLAFTPDGKTLASGHKRTDTKIEVTIWDVATAKERAHLKGGHTKHVFSVAFSPDGELLASGGEDDAVVLWQLSPAKKADK
jgi:WD40 repeat protein